jgi:hypothetical protein
MSEAGKEAYPDKPTGFFTAAELSTWLHASLTRLEQALGADDRMGILINRINARSCFNEYKRRGCRWDKASYGRYIRLRDAAQKWWIENPEQEEEEAA